MVESPYTDRFQKENRPALIISNRFINNTLDCIFLQITSKLKNDEFSFLLSDEMVNFQFKARSEIRLHKIFVAEKRLIKKKIGTLHEDVFKEVIKLFYQNFES